MLRWMRWHYSQPQDSKFDSWQAEVEHATSRSQYWIFKSAYITDFQALTTPALFYEWERENNSALLFNLVHI